MLSVQRGSRATLRPFRDCSPVSNHQAPSTHWAPMPFTCGLPSALMVASQHEWRFGAPGSGGLGVSRSRGGLVGGPPLRGGGGGGSQVLFVLFGGGTPQAGANPPCLLL